MTARAFDENKIRRNRDGTFANKDKRHAPRELPPPPAYSPYPEIEEDADDRIDMPLVSRSANWSTARGDPDAVGDTDRLAREDNQTYAGMDMERTISHKHRNGLGYGANTSDTARDRLMVETMPAEDKDAIGTLSVCMDYSPQYESLTNLNTMMPDTDVDYRPDCWESSMHALVRQAASGRGVNRENTRRMIAILNQVADHCRNDDNQASLAMAQIAVGHLALGQRHKAVQEACEALDYIDRQSDTYTAKTRHIVQDIIRTAANSD